ncbi:MAG: response regulator [Chloroflexota bacterium]
MPPIILLVDDEPDFCSALHDILEASGYDVHEASSAREALAVLDRIVPDLILSDVMMPGVDGLAFLRAVRARPEAARIKAVVVSAKGLPEDIEAARCAGADGYLVKPFSARELRETVDSFIGRKPA